MRLFVALSLSLAVALSASSAHATKNVSGPSVEAEALKYELRSALEFDDRASKDERISQLFFVDYGVNDWLAFRATARWSKPDGADHELTATEFMARFQLLESGDDGLSLGTRLIYTDARKAFAADSIAAQLLAEQKMDAWQFRITSEIEREFGANADSSVAMQFASQALYKMDDQFTVGAEWFGNVGNLATQQGYSKQQHQVGPVTVWNLTPSTAFEIGYLHGISAGASDSMVKWFVRGQF